MHQKITWDLETLQHLLTVFFITNNYFHYQWKQPVISLAAPIFVPYVNQGSRLSSFTNSSLPVRTVHYLTAVCFVSVLRSSSDDTFVRSAQFTNVITRYKKCKQYDFKIDLNLRMA